MKRPCVQAPFNHAQIPIGNVRTLAVPVPWQTLMSIGGTAAYTVISWSRVQQKCCSKKKKVPWRHQGPCKEISYQMRSHEQPDKCQPAGATFLRFFIIKQLWKDRCFTGKWQLCHNDYDIKAPWNNISSSRMALESGHPSRLKSWKYNLIAETDGSNSTPAEIVQFKACNFPWHLGIKIYKKCERWEKNQCKWYRPGNME